MSKRLKIEERPIKVIKNHSYISFGFKYLKETSFTDDKSSSFLCSFLIRLKSLCCLDWNTISSSARHSYGYEKIPTNIIKKDTGLTDEVKYLLAFRATGDNHVFLGFRQEDVFQIIFIESSFGDIYNH